MRGSPFHSAGGDEGKQRLEGAGSLCVTLGALCGATWSGGRLQQEFSLERPGCLQGKPSSPCPSLHSAERL